MIDDNVATRATVGLAGFVNGRISGDARFRQKAVIRRAVRQREEWAEPAIALVRPPVPAGLHTAALAPSVPLSARPESPEIPVPDDSSPNVRPGRR